VVLKSIQGEEVEAADVERAMLEAVSILTEVLLRAAASIAVGARPKEMESMVGVQQEVEPMVGVQQEVETLAVEVAVLSIPDLTLEVVTLMVLSAGPPTGHPTSPHRPLVLAILWSTLWTFWIFLSHFD
jgi:hypothetical protein